MSAKSIYQPLEVKERPERRHSIEEQPGPVFLFYSDFPRRLYIRGPCLRTFQCPLLFFTGFLCWNVYQSQTLKHQDSTKISSRQILKTLGSESLLLAD
jgi:hypothetical protein